MKKHLRLATVVAIAVFTLLSATGARADRKLGSHDQKLLNEARAKGEATVTLLIATVPGSAKAVADAIGARGGSVHYRHDQLGYIRVQVPTSQVEAIASLPGIQAANMDGVHQVPNPKPE